MLNETYTIKWSEFHYHFFAHLISADCPRELAEGLDLQIFKFSGKPDETRLDACVTACIESEDATDLNEKLTKLLIEWTHA